MDFFRQSIRELAQLAHEQFGLDGVDQELEDTYVLAGLLCLLLCMRVRNVGGAATS